MTLLEGVVRWWHQSDWFRAMTSRQRNALHTVITTSARQLTRHHICGHFHCVSATLLTTASSQGIWNPLRDGGAIPPCCCLQGQPSEVMVWRPQGNLSLQAHRLYERCHIHVPLCIIRVQQELCSLSCLICRSKLLEAEDLTQVESLIQGHFLLSLSLFLVLGFLLCFVLFCFGLFWFLGFFFVGFFLCFLFFSSYLVLLIPFPRKARWVPAMGLYELHCSQVWEGGEQRRARTMELLPQIVAHTALWGILSKKA